MVFLKLIFKLCLACFHCLCESTANWETLLDYLSLFNFTSGNWNLSLQRGWKFLGVEESIPNSEFGKDFLRLCGDGDLLFHDDCYKYLLLMVFRWRNLSIFFLLRILWFFLWSSSKWVSINLVIWYSSLVLETTFLMKARHILYSGKTYENSSKVSFSR